MRLLTPIIIVFLTSPAYTNAQGFLPCTLPAEPYQYQIDKKTDREFYDFARSEFQTYFEDMEKYLRCLENERATKLEELQRTYNLFKRNYGDDAVFKYNKTDEE